jgi:hypothetical protein
MTPDIGLSFAQAADLLATHLTDHDLPEPVSLTLTTRSEQSRISTQLRCTTVPKVAADLLTWADTLSTITVQAWRPPEGERVHLSITSTLTGPTGTIELDVFASAKDDPALFSDLNPDQRRSVSLKELRSWAGPTTSNPALETSQAPR